MKFRLLLILALSLPAPVAATVDDDSAVIEEAAPQLDIPQTVVYTPQDVPAPEAPPVEEIDLQWKLMGGAWVLACLANFFLTGWFKTGVAALTPKIANGPKGVFVIRTFSALVGICLGYGGGWMGEFPQAIRILMGLTTPLFGHAIYAMVGRRLQGLLGDVVGGRSLK